MTSFNQRKDINIFLEKPIINKKNIENTVQNICDLTQEYIKKEKEKEKKPEIMKTSEKNFYYSFIKKFVK